MQTLIAILVAVLVAALGCWACAEFIPGGFPRLIGQIFSVVIGFGIALPRLGGRIA